MAEVTPSSPVIAYHAGRAISVFPGVLGAAGTAGYVVNRDPADSYKLSHIDVSDSATAAPFGLLLSAGVLDDGVLVIKKGPLYYGSGVLVAGQTYYASSATPGKIGLFTDVSSGHEVVRVGYALTTSILMVEMDYNEVTKA